MPHDVTLPAHEIMVEAETLTGSFGRALTPHEQERLVAVIGAELIRLDALAATAPHPVHAPPTFREDEIKTYDAVRFGIEREPDGDDGAPFWLFPETVRVAGLLVCPDCGRDLEAGNDPSMPFTFLVCPRIPPGPLPAEDRPCHEGCALACGGAD